MATTQKFYRLRQRNVRYSTQMQTMSRGMYLTDQLIPEGYAKVMVNYDIDDTGSCIKTRKGRLLLDSFTYSGYRDLGKMHLTDYIYTYNTALDEVEDIKDVLISFGTYAKVENYLEGSVIQIPQVLQEPLYISKLNITKNNSNYKLYNNAWSLYCDKGSEDFKQVTNEDLGCITARTIKNAYVFDKKVANDLSYPIYTVMNNEIYAFSSGVLNARINTQQPSLSDFAAVNLELTRLKFQNRNGSYYLKRDPIHARVLNAAEAQASGFNILASEPYQLIDSSMGALKAMAIIGYEGSTDNSPPTDYTPVFSPNIGQPYWFRIYYQYQSSISAEYKIEVADGSTLFRTFTLVQDWTAFTAGGNNPLWVKLSPPYAQTVYKVTLRNQGQSNTESEMILDALVCNDDTLSQLAPKKFDLSTAKGMISWFSCIGLYGMKDIPDTILFSDAEDPSYFPYPNNGISFDNEILAVHNYLDMLLVITTDSIYVVQIGETVSQSVKKKVMTNVFIPEVDAMNAVILKDQIFFKTDTDFYVLKPNKYTSDATDLKNYTNSTAIANYTKFFTKETVDIFNKVYKPIINYKSKEHRQIVRFTDFDVINIESTVRNEEVHYVYTLVPKMYWHHLTTDLPNQDTDIVNQSGIDTFGNLNLHLIYNTMSRSYRLYLIGVGDDNTAYTDKRYRNKQSGAFYEIVPYNLPDYSEVLIIKEDLVGRSDTVVRTNPTFWSLTSWYENYNYFDTGNISIDDTFNKRYRELQMNIINRTQSKIRFYTDVRVDGKLNVTSTRYKMEHITDPEDAEYGLIYIVPEEVDFYKTMMTAYGDTTLEAEDDLESLTSYWEIDMSKFPDLDVATIKLKLWGKGRRSSFQCLCVDVKNYELSSLTWVYRIMNVR